MNKIISKEEGAMLIKALERLRQDMAKMDTDNSDDEKESTTNNNDDDEAAKCEIQES